MSNSPGKGLAILGYCSVFGLFIHIFLFIAILGTAVLLNNGKGQQFAAFHLRQMFGIGIVAILINAFTPIIEQGWLALLIISLIVLVAVLGLLSALRNQMIALPFIGDYFQKWFSFIK
ncbi:hypothetical protein JCM19294_132 [Nonlabens tegetincola]|uniref:Import component protein n=1 Tax=Nonlabens tegetincola TaxID=323273 RepID=A0A090QQ34_9FLAO|nr:hypothetical protein [Nonlabens tegetincola]GAK97596.1 hypothetical protein JCM19294_132 [Nonlabens tegetincola]